MNRVEHRGRRRKRMRNTFDTPENRDVRYVYSNPYVSRMAKRDFSLGEREEVRDLFEYTGIVNDDVDGARILRTKNGTSY